MSRAAANTSASHPAQTAPSASTRIDRARRAAKVRAVVTKPPVHTRLHEDIMRLAHLPLVLALFLACSSQDGAYQDQTGQSTCKFCSEGTRVSGNGCEACAPGTYAPARSNACTRCESGKYQNEAEQGSCKACPAGFTTFVGTDEVVRGATRCAGKQEKRGSFQGKDGVRWKHG